MGWPSCSITELNGVLDPSLGVGWTKSSQPWRKMVSPPHEICHWSSYHSNVKRKPEILPMLFPEVCLLHPCAAQNSRLHEASAECSKRNCEAHQALFRQKALVLQGLHAGRPTDTHWVETPWAIGLAFRFSGHLLLLKAWSLAFTFIWAVTYSIFIILSNSVTRVI